MSNQKSTINDNFREELRERFIKLVESQRGIQAKLSKAIGKKDNYFGVIKQGNPVNADHLRAVGIVFGPEKVAELLGIDRSIKSTIDDFSDAKKRIDNDISKDDCFSAFIQKNLVKECKDLMVELEKIDPSELSEVKAFIDFRISMKLQHVNNHQVEGDRRKKDIPYSPDRRKKVG